MQQNYKIILNSSLISPGRDVTFLLPPHFHFLSRERVLSVLPLLHFSESFSQPPLWEREKERERESYSGGDDTVSSQAVRANGGNVLSRGGRLQLGANDPKREQERKEVPTRGGEVRHQRQRVESHPGQRPRRRRLTRPSPPPPPPRPHLLASHLRRPLSRGQRPTLEPAGGARGEPDGHLRTHTSRLPTAAFSRQSRSSI